MIIYKNANWVEVEVMKEAGGCIFFTPLFFIPFETSYHTPTPHEFHKLFVCLVLYQKRVLPTNTSMK